MSNNQIKLIGKIQSMHNTIHPTHPIPLSNLKNLSYDELIKKLGDVNAEYLKGSGENRS